MAHSDCRFCSTLDVAQQVAPTRGYAGRAALLNSAFWGRGARLTIAFMEGEPALHERVAGIAERWLTETGADLEFEFWIETGRDPQDANIRVAFRPEKGSASTLGRYALAVERGEPTMNLGWMTPALPEPEANAVVLHEFGHALGLIHEHLNPVGSIAWKTETVTSDLRRTQGWDDATIAANMFAHYDPNTVFATDVDPLSIMMYPIPQSWTLDGFSTGFNTTLTEQDKTLIRAAYGVRTVFGAS